MLFRRDSIDAWGRFLGCHSQPHALGPAQGGLYGKPADLSRLIVFIFIFTATAISLPKNWQPMPTNSAGYESKFHLVDIVQGCSEFDDINALFMQSRPGVGIANLQRIQNPGLYEAFLAKKANMAKTGGDSSANEKLLFHGTAAATCNQICHFGFNRSYAGLNGKLVRVFTLRQTFGLS